MKVHIQRYVQRLIILTGITGSLLQRTIAFTEISSLKWHSSKPNLSNIDFKLPHKKKKMCALWSLFVVSWTQCSKFDRHDKALCSSPTCIFQIFHALLINEVNMCQAFPEVNRQIICDVNHRDFTVVFFYFRFSWQRKFQVGKSMPVSISSVANESYKSICMYRYALINWGLYCSSSFCHCENLILPKLLFLK